MTKPFLCHLCTKYVESERTDAESWAEFDKNFPELEHAHDNTAIICDDCYIVFMDWFNKLPQAEKDKMRDEHLKETKK